MIQYLGERPHGLPFLVEILQRFQGDIDSVDMCLYCRMNQDWGRDSIEKLLLLAIDERNKLRRIVTSNSMRISHPPRNIGSLHSDLYRLLPKLITS